jgi:hypothetical protein
MCLRLVAAIFGTEVESVDRMFAVAIRDGKDLFLWIRIRRAAGGDIYYMFPTGREGAEWKKWNPHGSLHKDGQLHHKSFDKKMSHKQVQKPDADFKGPHNFITRPISADEPRAFGVKCDPAEFSEVMEVPVSILSAKRYETSVSIDLTEPGGSPSPNTSDGQILVQQTFKDARPWIVVSVVFKPLA